MNPFPRLALAVLLAFKALSVVVFLISRYRLVPAVSARGGGTASE